MVLSFTALRLHGGKDFALADIMGIHFTGEHSDTEPYTGKELVLARGRVPLTRPAADIEVRSRLPLPDFRRATR